jgi:hypothetical protein
LPFILKFDSGMYEHLTCIESLKSLVRTFDMKLQCQENFFSKVKEKSLATEY